MAKIYLVIVLSKYKVDITGINTSELKVLGNEETIKLFKLYQNGDIRAKEQLINGNLKLVLSILKKFNRGNLNLDDLFQVGVIGLIKAIDNFDLSYGLKLSTYAVPLIIGEIKRYVRDNTALRISRSIKDLAYQIIKFKEEYISNYNKEPTPKEIAKYFNIEEYKVGFALNAMKDPASLFEPIYSDGGDTIYLFDQIADNRNVNENKDMIISLRKALLKIKERERQILVERFMVGKTQVELSKELNISQAQVSRIEKGALENVRKLIK